MNSGMRLIAFSDPVRFLRRQFAGADAVTL
jgi:hypothetical protein